MPAQRLKVTEHRRERSRSRSPWVRDPGPFSTDAAQASTISNNNNNQNTAYGPANFVNSNSNFNLQSSSVYYNQVTNIATSTPIHTPDISVCVAHDHRVNDLQSHFRTPFMLRLQQASPLMMCQESQPGLMPCSLEGTIRSSGRVRRAVELGLYGKHPRPDSERDRILDSGPRCPSDLLDHRNGGHWQDFNLQDCVQASKCKR